MNFNPMLMNPMMGINPMTNQNTMMNQNPMMGMNQNPMMGMNQNPMMGININPMMGININPMQGMNPNPMMGININPMQGMNPNPMMGINMNPMQGINQNPLIEINQNPLQGINQNPMQGMNINPMMGMNQNPMINMNQIGMNPLMNINGMIGNNPLGIIPMMTECKCPKCRMKNKANQLKNINDSLIYFFDFLCVGDAENIISEGEKVLVNFYNLLKKNVKIKLNLQIKNVIANIFWQIFYPSFKKYVYKRKEKSQTTEYIINNPTYDIEEEESPFKYEHILYLEYKGYNLSQYSNRTCREIGLKEGDEINLKIYPEFYNELTEFPKVPIFIFISNIIKRKDYFKVFMANSKGISTSIFSKLFTTPNYRLMAGEWTYLEKIPHLKGGEEISVERRLFGGGCCPIKFVDVSTGKVKELKFDEKAPKWREVNNGLNIFGICRNKKCEAFQKEVIHKTNLTKKGLVFNLNEEITNIKCPMCYKIIELKTCGFYECEYQFKGRSIREGDVKDFDSKTRETKDGKFEYYDPSNNGSVTWLELKIYVLSKQEIKYNPN